MRFWLERAGYSVVEHESARSVLDHDGETPSLACVDLGLGEVTGIKVIQHLRARDAELPIIVVTAQRELETAVAAMQAGAYDYVTATDVLVKDLAGLLRGTRDDLKAKVTDALDRIRQLEKENRQLKDKLASGQGTDLSAGARDIAGVKLVAAQVDGADAGALRNAVDQLKDKLKSAVIVLASVDATNKITLVAGVTADQIGKVKAGELVGNVAGQVGGKGGGRPDFAQAGGNNPAALGAALASVESFVRAKLGA
jgi:alanyl-tRNA synthetase